MIPRQTIIDFLKPLILAAWALTDDTTTPVLFLAYPNVGEPAARPAFGVRFGTAKVKDSAQTSGVDDAGDVTVSDQAETNVTITGIGAGAMEALEDVATKLRVPTSTWAAQRLNLAVVDRPTVIDVTKLVNAIGYEERGALSVNIRFINAVVDNVGFIDTVNLHGEYTGAAKNPFEQDFSLYIGPEQVKPVLGSSFILGASLLG